MTRLILTRQRSDDSGTFGEMMLPSGAVLKTGELPWRDNAPNLSCIPAGLYACVASPSPHFNNAVLYHVQNVQGRDHVMIHAANWMGDVDKGYHSDLEGCIAVGQAFGTLTPPDRNEPQDALLASKPALAQLHAELNMEPFELMINAI